MSRCVPLCPALQCGVWMGGSVCILVTPQPASALLGKRHGRRAAHGRTVRGAVSQPGRAVLVPAHPLLPCAALGMTARGVDSSQGGGCAPVRCVRRWVRSSTRVCI